MDDPRWWAALCGVALVLAGAGLARWRRAGEWPAMAIPLAVLVALTLLLGGIAASPRQLGERLPMLALLLGAPALLATAWRRRWVGWMALGLAALLAGWWMSGGTARGQDLARAWPVLAAVAAASLLPGAALGGAWQGVLLPVGLAGLLLIHAPPGPWAEAAALLALAGLAAAAYGPVLPLAGRIALGPMLAALAAGPLIARGGTPDVALAALVAAVALLGLVWRGWKGRTAQLALLAAGAAALYFQS